LVIAAGKEQNGDYCVVCGSEDCNCLMNKLNHCIEMFKDNNPFDSFANSDREKFYSYLQGIEQSDDKATTSKSKSKAKPYSKSKPEIRSQAEKVKTVTIPTVKPKVRSQTASQETPVVPQPKDSVITDSERRWNYVDCFKIPAGTGIVSIPVNSSLFGKWVTKHASRFSRWRGNLRLKFMINNSYIVNGNFHFIHANAYIAPGTTITKTRFRDFIGDIDHSVTGAPGESIELDLAWRTPKPYAPMLQNGSSYNGYVYVVIPLSSLPDTNAVGTTQITLYSDSSDIDFSLPKATSYSGDYTPVSISTYKRG